SVRCNNRLAEEAPQERNSRQRDDRTVKQEGDSVSEHLGCPQCWSQDVVEENPGKSHGQWGGRMRQRAFGGERWLPSSGHGFHRRNSVPIQPVVSARLRFVLIIFGAPLLRRLKAEFMARLRRASSSPPS
ncbi:MAG: hypothetical protein RJB38_1562, partial [Pseudomonadota bacterium]